MFLRRGPSLTTPGTLKHSAYKLMAKIGFLIIVTTGRLVTTYTPQVMS